MDLSWDGNRTDCFLVNISLIIGTKKIDVYGVDVNCFGFFAEKMTYA